MSFWYQTQGPGRMAQTARLVRATKGAHVNVIGAQLSSRLGNLSESQDRSYNTLISINFNSTIDLTKKTKRGTAQKIGRGKRLTGCRNPFFFGWPLPVF